MNTIQIRSPYVIFLGDIQDKTLAKTGAGLAKWCQDDVLGQLRLPNCQVDLGLADLTLEDAVAQGAKSLVIGVATVGGSIHADWLPIFASALEKGLDVINGLHTNLATMPLLLKAQARGTGRVVNVRQITNDLPIATGRKRKGLRLLTVGTDCAVGKKYTALELTRALNASSINATFRATGQTGIMIAGEGLPIDSVVSDFVSGAAELISPDNDDQHWDIIEGQGSLFNPSFSAVSMGLLHGSQPDLFIVCHDATRSRISTCPEYPMPDLRECIDLHQSCARIVNPRARCLGVSVNTSGLEPQTRRDYLNKLQAELELPCVDPLIDGCQAFVQLISEQFHQPVTDQAHAQN